MKSKSEIENLIADANEQMDEGSKYPGMTYEQGIEAACMWILGQQKDHPMKD